MASKKPAASRRHAPKTAPDGKTRAVYNEAHGVKNTGHDNGGLPEAYAASKKTPKSL